MIIKCEYCSKEYKILNCYYKRSKHHYCSKECSCKAKKQEIKTKCYFCNKEIILSKSFLKEKNFCNKKCFDKWQSRNKIKLICKTCKKTFYRSPSWINNKKGYYCCLECRNKNKEWTKKSYIKANQIQCKKKGLNKLELKGNEILKKLGLEYICQYLINDKICVDIYIPKYNLIIQWDGNYWHGKNIEYKCLDNRQKKRVDLDKSQDAYLKKCGFNILRFWEDEVNEREDYVYENIKRAIQQIDRRI